MTLATRWLRAGGRQVPLLAGPDALAELPGALAQSGFEGRLFIVALPDVSSGFCVQRSGLAGRRV